MEKEEREKIAQRGDPQNLLTGAMRGAQKASICTDDFNYKPHANIQVKETFLLQPRAKIKIGNHKPSLDHGQKDSKYRGCIKVQMAPRVL